MTKQLQLGQSTTKKSAQSKKCRMLAAVQNGTMSLKLAKLKLQYDPMLQAELTIEELEAAKAGTRIASSTSKKNMIVIEIDEADLIDDEE